VVPNVAPDCVTFAEYHKTNDISFQTVQVQTVEGHWGGLGRALGPAVATVLITPGGHWRV
jgi:hypothetical protein